MLKERILDKGIWIIAASALLTLSGASLIVCPNARAGSLAPVNAPLAPHQPTEASQTAMSLAPDDDGDELLEHWSDPKFSNEERLQIAIIAGSLSLGAVAGAARRKKLRRIRPND